MSSGIALAIGAIYGIVAFLVMGLGPNYGAKMRSRNMRRAREREAEKYRAHSEAPPVSKGPAPSTG